MMDSISIKKKTNHSNNHSKNNLMLRSQLFNDLSDGFESTTNEYDQHFNDNWSKESCDQFLMPIESFLDYQLKRERSSKRRCKEIVKLRNLVNEQNATEHQLKEYDMKINLNTLLKKGHGHSGQCPTAFIAPPHAPTSGTSGNYRALIADEIIRKNAQCDRCLYKNKRYEENYYNELMSLSFDTKPMNKRRKNKNKLGLNAYNNYKSTFSSSNATTTSTTKLPRLNLNRAFDFKSFQNSISSIESGAGRSKNDGENFGKSVLNKLPIEIQKNNIIN